MEHKDLDPAESDLIGTWVDVDGRLRGDPTTDRIHWLVAGRLDLLATDVSGYETLFRDRRDGRLWECCYAHGERHAGGPPRLTVITKEAARNKYPEGALG
jgi:hypothetical protein